MVNKKTLPDPPSSWDALTREQLIHIHSMERQSANDPMYKLQVFLYLAGLELCNESFYTQPKDIDMDADCKTLDEVEAKLQWLDSVVNGTADVTVVLRPTGSDSKDEMYSIGLEDLFEASQHFTKFLDDQFNLIDNRLGTVEIAGTEKDSEGNEVGIIREYMAPSPLITNITYEQYQNASNVMSIYYQYAKQIEALITEAQELKDTPYGRRRAKEIEHDIEELNKDMHTQQAAFCSHILCLDYPKRTTKKVATHNLLGIRTEKEIEVIDHDYHYDGDMAETVEKELADHMPKWLFPILYQQFQSSLVVYQQKFTHLFKKSHGGGSPEDALKAMTGTVNSVMKEYGYNKQQDVMQTNAVFVFDALDTMCRQAEEHEKQMKKLKRK